MEFERLERLMNLPKSMIDRIKATLCVTLMLSSFCVSTIRIFSNDGLLNMLLDLKLWPTLLLSCYSMRSVFDFTINCAMELKNGSYQNTRKSKVTKMSEDMTTLLLATTIYCIATGVMLLALDTTPIWLQVFAMFILNIFFHGFIFCEIVLYLDTPMKMFRLKERELQEQEQKRREERETQKRQERSNQLSQGDINKYEQELVKDLRDKRDKKNELGLN